MMKDIEINADKYDIVFVKNQKDIKSLEWNFVSISKSSLIYGFNIGLSSKILPSNKSLEWNINIKDKPVIKADCSLITGNNLLRQQAIIRLKTALGELKSRPNIGSKLEELRHKEINEKLIEQIKSYCIESLSEIIPNINLEIKYDISTYTRNIVIILRDGKTLLTRYKLEV